MAGDTRNATAGVGGGAAEIKARDRCAIVSPVRRGPLPEKLVGGKLAVEDVSLREADDRLEVRRDERLDVDDARRESRGHGLDDTEGSPCQIGLLIGPGCPI